MFDSFGNFQPSPRFRVVGGSLLGLPSWARTVLAVIAFPGIVLVALSICLLLVSILALLLLAVPSYLLLRKMTGIGVGEAVGERAPFDASRKKRVDVRVVE